MVASRESGMLRAPVLHNASQKTVGDAGIERRTRLVGHDVDEEGIPHNTTIMPDRGLLYNSEMPRLSFRGSAATEESRARPGGRELSRGGEA